MTEIDKQYGKLTVIGRAAPKNGKTFLLCRCSCGIEKAVRGDHLRTGLIKSCGCLRREMGISKKREEVGNRYGRLTVTQEVCPNAGGAIKWSCLCNCGNTTTVSGASLRNGHTKSCGCLHREITKKAAKRRRKRNEITVESDHAIIWLPNGSATLIDVDDIPLVREFCWCQVGKYVKSTKAIKEIWLHWLILGLDGTNGRVDHIDSNPLNNKKKNLRVCAQSANTQRARQRIGKSGFIGVRQRSVHSFRADIRINGKRRCLNSFKTAEAAAAAYDQAALKHYGPHARTNSVTTGDDNESS